VWKNREKIKKPKISRPISQALDVVIDETRADDRFAYTVRSFLELAGLDVSASDPFVSNKRVWRYDKHSNNAFGEEGIINRSNL
jgi:hypothetical protein